MANFRFLEGARCWARGVTARALWLAWNPITIKITCEALFGACWSIMAAGAVAVTAVPAGFRKKY